MFTILSALGYLYFANDSFRLLSNPEEIVANSLKQFNEKWLEIVRKEWGDRFGPTYIFINTDPFITVERVLIGAVTRRDIRSFITSLIKIHDALQLHSKKDDAFALDNYLSYHLGTVARLAGEMKLDEHLMALLEYLDEITTPSRKAIWDAKLTLFSPPAGTLLIREILTSAMENRIEEVANRAVFRLSERAKQMLNGLPKKEELYLTNVFDNVKMELTEEEKEIRTANDWMVDNYEQGFLSHLGDVGVFAMGNSLPTISASASNELCDQAITILSSIEDQRYQFLLLRSALWGIGKIVDEACRKKVKGAIRLGLLPYGKYVKANPDNNTFLLRYVSEVFIKMANYGIFEYGDAITLAILTINLGFYDPKISQRIISVYLEIAKGLQRETSQYNVDENSVVIKEILNRIDQLANNISYGKKRSSVTKAANRAKKAINSLTHKE